jgi:hypothetical protein
VPIAWGPLGRGKRNTGLTIGRQNKVRELRFHLQRQQVRITYWLASGKRVILLTMFFKTQRSEVAEVERAFIAQKDCEAGHGHAENVYNREISDE